MTWHQKRIELYDDDRVKNQFKKYEECMKLKIDSNDECEAPHAVFSGTSNAAISDTF